MTALSDDDRPLYRALGIFPEGVWIPEKIVTMFWRKLAGLSATSCTEILTQFERLALVKRDSDQRTVRIEGQLHSQNRYKIREQYATLQTEFVAALGDLHALPDDYAWRNLAYHLIEGGKADRLYTLLTDYHWLQAKLDATDANALEADCTAYIEAVHDGEKVEAVRLIRSALVIGGHILNSDKSQLPYQLTGKLWIHRNNPHLAPLWRICHTITPWEFIETQEYPPMLQADSALVYSLISHRSRLVGSLQLADGRILLWSRDTTNLTLCSYDGQPLATLTGHTSQVTGALQLVNGCILSWSWDCTLRLWSLDGQSLAILDGHTTQVMGAVQLSDGNLLSWEMDYYSDDYTVRLWSSDGLSLTPWTGHIGWIVGMLTLSDGRVLSWADDMTLRLWSSDGKSLAILNGHTDEVRGALALQSGNLLSWSRDTTLRLWSPDGQPLAVLIGHTGRVKRAFALPDERLLSWGDDEILYLWSKDGHPLAHLDDWKQNQARLAEWSQTHVVDVSVLYDKQQHILGTPFVHTMNNRLWIHEAKPFVGDTDFTILTLSGQTIVVGDTAGRVIFLRVRGSGM